MAHQKITEQTLKTYLEPGEVESLIQAATNLRDKLIIQLLARTGCRVSELCSLETANIDFQRGIILIEHLKRIVRRECPNCGKKVGTRNKFCPYCGSALEQMGPEKQRRQRLIRLDRDTLVLMREYLEKRARKSDRVISLSRQRVDRVLKNAAVRAGLGGRILLNPESGSGTRHQVSSHRLRDALAIRWLRARNDPEGQKALQEHLGHKRFDSTARYLKLDIEQVGKVYDDVFREESAEVKGQGREADGD